MAESAADIITDALQEILVQASEQPVESSEMQSGIRYLNRMMAEWDALGYALGYTIVSNPSDEVTVPAGAVNAIVLNLALKLAQQYDEPVSPSLVSAAQDGMTAVRMLTVKVQPTAYPSTLPVGSGQESWPYTEHFYQGEDDQVLTEDDGNILLESGT